MWPFKQIGFRIMNYRRKQQKHIKRDKRSLKGSKKSRMMDAWHDKGEYPPLPDVSAWIKSRESLPHVNNLEHYADKCLSQHGEDGITYELLDRIGLTSRKCIELGCGHNGGNSGILVSGMGFKGLWVDGDPDLVAMATARFSDYPVTTKASWITCETINNLITDTGFNGEIDYLCIGDCK